MIVRTLSNTLLTDNINKVKDGESQLKRVFGKIVDDLGIYYKIGLTTDFTGKLFNEMYSWLGFSQDKLNDVVLTPAYVATLLAKLARVNKDSYVWDFATGSAGLLVAAMNEMLNDAKNSITSPEELRRKEVQIKAEQLLGLELLSSIYMLAILNMILMGDGSANILNKDSLADFNGKYGFGDTDKNFPADAFILNPPYSAKGNGMVFVEKALGMMNKGYAAVIIQNSAGSGKARDNNREILKNNTLLASIKMPIDLFIGKSSVQTNIYVFKVGEPHDAKSPVRFIDFSNDGYTRTNRKKPATTSKTPTTHADVMKNW
ncbi:N-6 DNA Methylase [Neisseria elongata subsp. glycolytica ATCC 29315]|uniref:site-specific DNA-methyltransferase (adenine-specific) n=1 Tax=Neisseria elongata subsp. glycolytica ATCC 29315 TaxID=546263 RepID=D4DRD6_NEIEG|nr:N-6 DNA Methylase [Neisseria elongata subsp. glycolytica ATCC 29315]